MPVCVFEQRPHRPPPLRQSLRTFAPFLPLTRIRRMALRHRCRARSRSVALPVAYANRTCTSEPVHTAPSARPKSRRAWLSLAALPALPAPLLRNTAWAQTASTEARCRRRRWLQRVTGARAGTRHRRLLPHPRRRTRQEEPSRRVQVLIWPLFPRAPHPHTLCTPSHVGSSCAKRATRARLHCVHRRCVAAAATGQPRKRQPSE